LVLGAGFLSTIEAAPRRASASKKHAGRHGKTARHVKKNGHSLMSRGKMKQLRSGTHHVHTTHGHKVYYVLNRGKVKNVFLKAPNGKRITGHRVRGARAAGDTNGLDRREFVSMEEVVPVGAFDNDDGDNGNVTFQFQISANGVTITFSLSFPADSVLGGNGGDDDDDDNDE
jgi:hypothetical protein